MNSPFETSYYYHFYNRGNNKEKIFFAEENYKYFLKLVEKYLLQISDIYSYCLLPNHFHFVLRIKDYEDLSEGIKEGKTKLHQPISNLFNAYTKAINKKYSRTGSLFQKHPKRIKIENEDYFKNLIIYVNTNSSHHSLEDFRKYKYSSYNLLMNNNPTFLKRNDVLELFENTENFKYCLNNKRINLELIKNSIQGDD